jgi:hypothetical protein
MQVAGDLVEDQLSDSQHILPASMEQLTVALGSWNWDVGFLFDT